MVQINVTHTSKIDVTLYLYRVSPSLGDVLCVYSQNAISYEAPLSFVTKFKIRTDGFFYDKTIEVSPSDNVINIILE
jgi:hypothetical protein